MLNVFTLSLRSVVPALRCPCAPLSLRSVVPALRCPCAPLSLRSVVPCLWLACLSLAFLLAAPDARAGTYVEVGIDPFSFLPSPYSGGTHLVPNSSDGTTLNQSDALTNYGYGGGSGGVSAASCTGAMTAAWIWTHGQNQSDANDPPPAQVLVSESATASIGEVIPFMTGYYDTGMGKTGMVTCMPGGSNNSISGSSVRYSVQAGGSFVSLPSVTPVSNGSGYGSSGLVEYTAAISPVFVIPGGAIKDSGGTYSILVGQKCTATLVGVPSIPGATASYAWTGGKTTFQSWSPTTPQIGTTPANSQASYEDDGPIPSTNPTSWYWNDPANATETVTCTATITPPNGQGNPFSVTATQQVTVYVPGFTFNATPGYIQINTKAPNQGGALDLYAGGLSGGSAGLIWTATCTTPPLFGKGNVELIQIATPNLSYTEYVGLMKVGPQHNDPQNGQTGLDGLCPYPGSSYTEGGTPFTSNDSPTAPLSNSIGSIIMTHQFTDYLMYIPPGSSQVVPLATLTWGLNMTGSAIIPATVNWADYAKQHGTDSAGTVTTTTQQGTNKFPKWTLINGPQPINSF